MDESIENYSKIKKDKIPRNFEFSLEVKLESIT